MIGIGPVSIHVIVVIGAAILAWLVARMLARRLAHAPCRAAGSLVLDALLVGLAAARLGYIARWWDEYAASPRAMLAIGDGGFSWWAGLTTGLLFVLWRTRSARELRRPVVTGMLAGMIAWAGAGAVIDEPRRTAPTLPEMQLSTPDGHTVGLSTYIGRPVAINLWATWCPPCRREMPVFAEAQSAYPEIAFVMINQGESTQAIRGFLEQEALTLTDVLLDPSSDMMRVMHAGGLPTTLFFDAQGRLVDSHVGEMTMASLKNTISRRFAHSPSP